MFDGHRVTGTEREIGDGHPSQDRVYPESEHEGEGAKQDGYCDGGLGLEPARSDGPVAFDGMFAVGLRIQRIIDEIDRAGKKTEEGEDDKGRRQVFSVSQPFSEYHPGKDDEVFRPLPGSYGFYNRGKHRSNYFIYAPVAYSCASGALVRLWRIP